MKGPDVLAAEHYEIGEQISKLKTQDRQLKVMAVKWAIDNNVYEVLDIRWESLLPRKVWKSLKGKG